MFTVGIIGYGKLGSAFVRQFSSMKNLFWIVEKDDKRVSAFQKEYPKVNCYSSLTEIKELPDYIFLTITDAQIESTAKQLSDAFGDKLQGKNIIHCAGALPLSILDSCKELGAKTGSIHPYQTFYFPADDLFKCAWSIDSNDIEDELFNMVRLFGGNPFKASRDEKMKALYHCSAVVASNFTNVLLSLSKDISDKASLDAKELIPPIIKQTIENNIKSLEDNSEIPLTGPFARADVDVIKQHLEALNENKSMQKEYIYLALFVNERLHSLKYVTDEQYHDMEEILKSYLS